MASTVVSARNYMVVTFGYWSLTLTDGALRMLVLLHFYVLGYSPFQLALLFVLYEVLGAVTNLLGGVVASRIGLKVTLVAGLGLQVVALLMLSGMQTAWSVPQQVAYVLVAQGLSGVAKDLTKLSAKTAIKFTVPTDTHSALFKWVALLTGSKNTLKGLGFFAGGALLSVAGFHGSLWGMAGLVALAVSVCAVALPADLGRVKSKAPISQMFSNNRAVNTLSAARVFLFGARDVWFVVALPVFLSESLGWAFAEVGAAMAAWVVGYGCIQAVAPKLLRHGSGHDDPRAVRVWGVALALCAFGIAGALQLQVSAALAVGVGLAVFGGLFAVTSSLHSYLILAYADADRVAASVGFYYMANALGRLLGTLLSGAVYMIAGLVGCLVVAGCMLLVSAVVAVWLPATPAAQA